VAGFNPINDNIPVPVMTPTRKVDGMLTFELELGEPLPTDQWVLLVATDIFGRVRY